MTARSRSRQRPAEPARLRLVDRDGATDLGMASLAASPLSSHADESATARPITGRPLFVLACLTACGLAALSIDLPTTRFFQSSLAPRELAAALQRCEPFGHGYGIVIAGLAVAAFDRRSWRLLARVWGAALLAGLSANVVKLLLSRTRPRDLNWSAVDSVGDTFVGWMPILSGGIGGQSFPSAHTAAAMGLAVALASLYPRAAWFAYLMAGLVGLQRIQSSAHFVSDVCWGAALGWAAVQLWLNSPRVRATLANWEQSPHDA